MRNRHTLAFVTGATGFIGANLVRQLLDCGYAVRSLVRPESNRRNIDGLDIEVCPGDLADRNALARSMKGCDVLFHVAAVYTFWSPRPGDIARTNIEGTRNILEAAVECGVEKVVCTSSESTIGIKEGGCPGTEAGQPEPDELPCHYKRSKYEAEKVALDAWRQGLPLVVVNPTTPIGPLDIKPTPTGQVVVDFLNGRMPAYVNTGLNIIHVQDVARGHILALERGRPGERYVLGNRNMTLREMLAALEQASGVRSPRWRIPIWAALIGACADELFTGRLMGNRPRVSVASVKVARRFRFFDCTKAVKELGLPQTPVEEAFRGAVEWFRQNGYAS